MTNLLVENELNKLQTFNSGFFISQIFFHNDAAQLYLIFQPIYKIFTTFSGIIDRISEWKSKGLPDKKFMCA